MSKEIEPVLSVQFESIPETLESPFCDIFAGYEGGLVRGNPGDSVLPAKYAANADKIFRFEPKTDDVWVVTFPKCGTTWTQEMVWLIANDCDFDGAKVDLNIRSPFLEAPFFLSEEILNKLFASDLARGIEDVRGNFLSSVEQSSGPRIIKTHLPLHLLHPKLLDTCKVVYVARNPKDVIVSYFHHHRLFFYYKFNGELEEFAEYFIQDKVMYSPFFDHLREVWNQRHHPNVHFVFYEDFKRDLRGGIREMARFLQKPLTDEQLVRLTEHLRFENFSKNDAVNSESFKQLGVMSLTGSFVRKGKTGDWKNHFSPELNKRIDDWIALNLDGTDLKCEFDKRS